MIRSPQAERTWGICAADDGTIIVGPQQQLPAAPAWTVTAIDAVGIPSGMSVERRHVRENAQEFDVTYYDFPDGDGLYHHRGGNWILWTRDARHFSVVRGAEEWDRTWVYARFLLRHLIVSALVARPGYRAVHAVAGAVSGAENTSLLIVGPFRAGKSYLLRALIERGVVSEEVEDDCAVIGPDWRLHTLLPAEHETRILRSSSICAVICLDRAAIRSESIALAAAVPWIAAIQTSWPLGWVPGAPEAQSPLAAAPAVPCMRMPEQPPLTAPLLRRIEHLCGSLGR